MIVGRPSLGAAATALTRSTGVPYAACLLIGLGGLFSGVTGPLLSTFVPLLVQSAIGNLPTVIGVVMAIDNVLLLLLVPWAGAASDRARARGRGRLTIVVVGFVLASAGMALMVSPVAGGAAGLLAAMVVTYAGINLQRSPVQALLADVVPSRYRSMATGSVTFQMCVGGVVFLMLGQLQGLRVAFLCAAGTVLAIAAAFAFGFRRTTASASASVPEGTLGAIVTAVRSLVRGAVPGMRAVFLASFLLQLTFQTFTTWYSLHAIERFGVGPQDVAGGMIAWALGGVIGALPAGAIGVRVGRRRAMLAGFALMAICLIALHSVTTMPQAMPLLALVSASWTLPMVNGYPLFVEPVPPPQRGVLAALFLLSMALGGAIGDPLNGVVFDLSGSYRPLFLTMTVYTMLALAAVIAVPRGAGEADTGPSAEVSWPARGN